MLKRYLFFFSLISLNLRAEPQGASVVSGEAIIFGSSELLKVQTSTERTLIEWDQFSIGANENVQFLQPSNHSCILNQVIGSDPSSILGSLQSNGIIYLINPRGILFGENSQIDTAGFLASTIDADRALFLGGQDLIFKGNSEESLINLGKIKVNGGDLFLFAHKIENRGVLEASNGLVSLLAGHEILIKPESFPILTIRPDLRALSLENFGTIEALNAQLEVDSISNLAIHQEGIIHLTQEGGKLFLVSEGGAMIENGAYLTAPKGEISITTKDGPLYQLGMLNAEKISIESTKLLHTGSLSAEKISLQIKDSMIETASAQIHVGTGEIEVKAGRLFSSGHYQARGEKGGKIHLLGDEILLTGAQIDASGTEIGGTILIGGDYQGKNPSISNAQKTYLSGSCQVKADGDLEGGKIIVWSDEKTQNFANLSASGKKGGFIEISSKKELIQRGDAFANGEDGQIFFDPQNIVISTSGSYPSYALINPNPGPGFGTEVVVLGNGNLVVANPDDNFAASSSGAVYLYNGATGALLSAITGSQVDDQIGSDGVEALIGNNNYVIGSSPWNNGAQSRAGASTWGSGTMGVSGVVSAANSLIGSTAGDEIGRDTTALTNGNYVTYNSGWSQVDGGAVPFVGAATWGNGTTGITGTVSVANSLVGSTDSDEVSSFGVVALTNGNYVVASENWSRVDGGAVSSVGAATWGNGTTGITGTVSVANSLIGSTDSDQVSAPGITALANSHYVVRSKNWSRVDGGAVSSVGAATWGNGTTGITGTVSVANSLIGSTDSDQVSSTGITLLTNGNYVVRSLTWSRVDGGAVASVGAATWGNAATGITGTVSASNSLIGSTDSDQVGFSGITTLTNGNYVVRSQTWSRVDGGAIASVGAATWGNGATGITGTVSVANSLIGSTVNDRVGLEGVALTNGNYVVGNIQWSRVDGGAQTAVGAATWGNGTTGITGTVSVNNSLIGSSFGDIIGGTTALTNGNYVVTSSLWSRVDGGAVALVGSATWGNGTTGITGTVSVTNSLIGSTANDFVGNGRAVALTNGNYVVPSVAWNRVDGGAVTDVGAATWGNGTTGITGTVSVANSLIGSTANDQVGFNGITALANGNYVVRTQSWSLVDGGPVSSVGAATWGNGTAGIAGTVSVVNSLIGSTANDRVGRSATVLDNGNYLITSEFWDRVDGGALIDAGAVTWGSGATGITGTVSSINSVIGSSANSGLDPGQENEVEPSTFICSFVDEGEVQIGLTDISSLSYALAADQTITILPTTLNSLLTGGTSVTFQANDDITISSPLSFNTGNLTLQAGRSIFFNAAINTGGADLSATANEPLSDGVIDSSRTAGSAVIAVADGVILNAAGGDIVLSLLDGSGKTNSTSGDVTIGTGSALVTTGSGNIELFAQTNNVSFTNTGTLSSVDGSILVQAGVSVLASGAFSFQNTGLGTTTFVSDNLYPTSPGMGSGLITMPLAVFTSNQGVLFYATDPSAISLPATINGQPFTPGEGPPYEEGGTYYP